MTLTAQDCVRALDTALSTNNEAVKDALSQLITTISLSNEPRGVGPLEQMWLEFSMTQNRLAALVQQLEMMAYDYQQLKNNAGYGYNPLNTTASKITMLETKLSTLENKLAQSAQALLGVQPTGDGRTLTKTYVSPSIYPWSITT